MLEVSHCRSLKVLPNLPNPFRGSNLRKFDCKIVEIKGMFKLEPLENVDPEIINEMGLSYELETMGSLEMVELCDSWDEGFESQKKVPLQIVYDEFEDKGSQHHKTYSSHQDVTPVGDLSGYQVIPGHYLLCNYGCRKRVEFSHIGRRNNIEIYHRDEIDESVQIIFWGFPDSEEDTAGSSGFRDEESGRRDEESARLTDEE
ncbi:hypothetical protein Vadar_024356 [Vaccinium darrowii]|uniref:Uncharacterized protein n=1 Tax=Vaccinium darrowii TaxID=229202 RepID=A0ACB7ZLA0_9ERIC|nr:hypothetical protein Vadar_024356 [Vaccinium darrowii]